MNIRRAKFEDSRVLARLIMDASESVRDSDFSEDGWKLLERTNTVAAFEKRFSSENYFALLCEIESEPAAYIAMTDFEKIDHMFVLPQFRRLGVSRKLWNEAIDTCEKYGRGCYYWVRSSTAAEPVYEAFGFRSAGERNTSSGISSRLMEMGVKDKD